jgi:hypothetical protein
MHAAVERHVIECGRLPDEKAKRGYLQALLGAPSDDQGLLQFRAVLMTELDRAQVWPHRVARESAFDQT